MGFGKTMKNFGRGFVRGIGNVGKGVYKLGRGALNIVKNPFTQQLVSAIAPQLAPAAMAAGAAAGGISSSLDSIERGVKNRDALGVIKDSKDLYNSRNTYKRQMTDGYDQTRRQRQRR